MFRKIQPHPGARAGQSIVEITILLPLLLLIVLNAVNLGYFYLVAMNMVAAPRSGVQYSMEGFGSIAGARLADPGPVTSATSVSYLTLLDINGALPSSSDASVQVCSKILGVNGTGTNQTAKCSSFGSVSFGAPNADPEAPWFVLNRVEVSYTFSPLIPGTPFGLALLPSGACTAPGLTMT